MNGDKSAVTKQNELQSKACVNTIENSQQQGNREILSPFTDSVSCDERLSLTSTGKEGKMLRLRLAKSLASTTGKNKPIAIRENKSNAAPVYGKEKQLKTELAQEVFFQHKESDDKTLIKPARSSDTEKSDRQGQFNIQHRNSDTVLTQGYTEANILTSSADREIKNNSTDAAEAKEAEQRTTSRNVDWRTLLQTKTRISNKRTVSQIPVAVRNGGDKGNKFVTSQITKQTSPQKPDLVRKSSDHSQKKLPKPPTTSLCSTSPHKGNDISEDVEKKIEYARNLLQKRSSASNKEELYLEKGSLSRNDKIRYFNEAVTQNVDAVTGRYKKGAAFHWGRFDSLENELRQFKENVSKNIEEIQKIKTVAKQLQGQVELVRAERLELFGDVKSNGNVDKKQHGLRNTNSVYNAML